VFGECCEDLAVEDDLLLRCSSNELTEGVSEGAKSGVDLDLPQAAEVVLLVLTVCELIAPGFAEGDLCLDLFLGAAETIALCSLQYRAAALIGSCSSFDA